MHACITPDKTEENPSQVWVFFDEINTNKHQNLLKDLMVDRKFYYNTNSKDHSIPANMRFFAACNPYNFQNRNKKRQDDELECKFLGPVINKKFLKSKFSKKNQERKRRDEIRMKLTHQVNPLNKSLMEFVWDFKSLRQEDEKDYMHCMIKGLDKARKERLVEIVYQAQNYIKKTVEENESSVSLRDLDRVNTVFHFGVVFLEHLESYKEDMIPFADRFENHKEAKFMSMNELNEEDFFKCVCLTVSLNYLFRVYKIGKC